MLPMPSGHIRKNTKSLNARKLKSPLGAIHAKSSNYMSRPLNVETAKDDKRKLFEP